MYDRYSRCTDCGAFRGDTHSINCKADRSGGPGCGCVVGLTALVFLLPFILDLLRGAR